MNLHDLFEIPRRRTPDKAVLQSEVNGVARELTYRQLYDTVDQLAAGLQRWGLAKGDRAAFYCNSRPEFVIAYLAVLRVGALMVPINLRYRRLEIGHILADCTPRLLVTERCQSEILADVGDALAPLAAILYADDLQQWLGEADHLQPVTVEGDDLAMIIYTSGTTGRSKGAMITHNNVLATVTGLVNAWAWEQSDLLLLCLPLFHTHGLIVGLHCALVAGATILLRPVVDADAIIADLVSGAPTLFFAVPTIYLRLIDRLRSRGPVDLSHMRLFCSGSAPLAAETHVEFEELTGFKILERYGMTETGMNLSNPYAGARVPGSVGTPLPGVSMRIVEQSKMTDVTPGEEGVLLVRGGNVFSAYWNAPEKTAESFVHDELGRRWFVTGDLARQDAETGYVTLLGRSHELIISGGFNIYPREIEELLESFDGVIEAAVIGVSHAEWGEVPVAYLVCNGTLDPERLMAYCRTQLAGFKVPKAFYEVDALPRNAMGKLQKHRLKGERDS